MRKLLIFIAAFSLACRHRKEPTKNEVKAMSFLTRPDHQAMVLVALKHDVDTVTANKLIQSYLDHFDLIHLISTSKGNVYSMLNPKGQYRVIDSLSSALSVPK